MRSGRPCFSTDTLAEIRELRRRNLEHLSDGRRLRSRRDDILTSAAAVGGRLVRDAVHRDPVALAELAASAETSFDGRSLREPLTLLARLLIGPGRSRNAYTTVGRAAAFAAASRGNDLEAVIRAAGGVTGAAAQHDAIHRRPGLAPEPRSLLPRAAGTVSVVATAGVLAAMPAGSAPCHAVIRRVGRNVLELLLVAGTAHVRLSLGPASPDDLEPGGRRGGARCGPCTWGSSMGFGSRWRSAPPPFARPSARARRRSLRWPSATRRWDWPEAYRWCGPRRPGAAPAHGGPEGARGCAAPYS